MMEMEVSSLRCRGYWCVICFILDLSTQAASQESAVFTERRALFEVWEVLPEIDERIELKYLMPEKIWEK